MIEICSKDRINQIISSTTSRNLVILSIYDTDKSPAFDPNNFKFASKIEDVCILSFDDVLADDDYPGAKAMSDTDAKVILEFAERHIKEIIRDSRTFYVQCNGGVSRSAAVAAALSVTFGSDDWWIFNDVKFSPNRHVYELLLNVAGIKLNKNIVDDKFRKNLYLSMV